MSEDPSSGSVNFEPSSRNEITLSSPSLTIGTCSKSKMKRKQDACEHSSGAVDRASTLTHLPSRLEIRNTKESSTYANYAKRFAVLTIVTAYLGNHATAEKSDGSGDITTSFATSTLFGLGLYGDSIVPRLVYSKELVVYFLCLYWIGMYCWKRARFHTSNFFHRTTSQVLLHIKSSSSQTAMSLSRMQSAAFLSSTKAPRKEHDTGRTPNLNNGSIKSQFSILQSRPKHGTSSSDIIGQSGSSLIFSASESFVSEELVNKLTLRDMAQLFTYSLQMNHRDFDRTVFLNQTRPNTQRVIEAMDQALDIAREHHAPVVSCVDISNLRSDSMDALAFVAVARIFAEWRTLRVVPEGYTNFGFGMSLARRDLIKNVSKIEQAVHNWLEFYRSNEIVVLTNPTATEGSRPAATITTPTLRQLLQHEKEKNLHPKLPVLRDQSAASGLLWTKRQIQYQSLTLRNNAQVPVEFPSPKAALGAAYEAVYGKYHGFLVKAVFQSTLNAAPPSQDILHHLNQPYLEERQEPPTASTVAPIPSSSTSSVSVDADKDEMWLHVSLDDDANVDRGGDSTAPADKDNLVEAKSLVDASIRTSFISTVYQSSEEKDVPEHHAEMELGDKIVQIFTSIFAPCVVGCHQDQLTMVTGIGQQQQQQQKKVRRQCHNIISSYHNLSDYGHPHSNHQGNHHSSKDYQEFHATGNTVVEQNDLPYYLSILQRVESGLDSLIEELNMNDPSRV